MLSMRYMMHEGMGGQHEFSVHLLTNDPQEPEKLISVRSNWIP